MLLSQQRSRFCENHFVGSCDRDKKAPHPSPPMLLPLLCRNVRLALRTPHAGTRVACFFPGGRIASLSDCRQRLHPSSFLRALFLEAQCRERMSFLTYMGEFSHQEKHIVQTVLRKIPWVWVSDGRCAGKQEALCILIKRYMFLNKVAHLNSI